MWEMARHVSDADNNIKSLMERTCELELQNWAGKECSYRLFDCNEQFETDICVLCQYIWLILNYLNWFKDLFCVEKGNSQINAVNINTAGDVSSGSQAIDLCANDAMLHL